MNTIHIVKSRTFHGMTNTPTYSTWHGMVQRATNINHKRYKDYGHLGIDNRWVNGDGTISGFGCFLMDMGEKPQDLTLDRIDNNRGYYKFNCRWSTLSNQMHHQKLRKSKVPYRGVHLNKNPFKKYTAEIKYNYAKIFLGDYYTSEEAALAYDVAAIQLRGEFADTNILGAL